MTRTLLIYAAGEFTGHTHHKREGGNDFLGIAI